MNRRGQANDINYDEPNGNGLRLVDDFNFVCNGYIGNQRFGFIAIGDLDQAIQTTAGNNATPWSRFHLVHNVRDITPEGDGYRQWMRNGVMYTGRGLQMYLGQKYGLSGAAEVTGQGSAVLQFGDDALNANRQTMRFLYTVNPDALATTGASSVEGLELMRLWPETLTEGFVGIGDFFAGADQPTQRLDVRTGKVRIRQLPTDPIMTTSTKMMVVEDLTGVVGWQNIPTGGGGGPDCDWLVDGTGLDVTTAWDPSAPAGCPNNTWKVGIGTDVPQNNTKVHIKDNDHLGAYDEAALMVEMAGDADKSVRGYFETNRLAPSCLESWGLHALAYNGSVYNAGVRGYVELQSGRGTSSTDNVGTRGAVHIASESREVWGAEGNVFVKTGCSARRAIGSLGWVVVDPVGSTGTVSESYGVLGRTYVGDTQYGVYGKVDQPPPGNSSYGVYGVETAGGNGAAVYAEGDLVHTGALINASDAMFKSNVQPLAGATPKLMQIAPHTYETDSANYGYVGMDGGSHMGVIAQELQAVFPELVRTVTRPAEYDSAGALVHPSLQFMAVNYQELIPLLIAGFQEQQAQLAAMQQALAACCVGVPTDGGLFQGQGNNTGTGTQDLSRMASEDLLTIAPNPFEDHTTISYRNASPGRVMLRVSDSRGQHIDTLRDAMQDAGAFTYEWNTVSLAPGMYTVSLLLDGQLLVERAVKVGR
ncbi:MAG: tail fiber domain-containing protein [Flavobacteriales bacterium]|nr:MAG: tail fiber domain-containing protein [Flavobacteriales bacterium]